MAKKINYIRRYKPLHPNAKQNGCVEEHRLVAEKMIGRYLRKEEVVHHINQNRLDNRPENLMVFATSRDHAAFHKGRKIK